MFVRRHAKLGKSRPRRNQQYPQAVWLGAPRSARFIRAYHKKEVNAFRIEMQFNRGYLRKHGINASSDFPRLAKAFGEDLRFYKINWPKVNNYAHRHLRLADDVVRMARERQHNLGEVLSLLRKVIPNANRFLIPLKLNDGVRQALTRWREQWK